MELVFWWIGAKIQHMTLYQLYHTILQYTQHPNFYFPILLIKIIFLHNKIHIIIKIIFSYSTLSLKYNFFLDGIALQCNLTYEIALQRYAKTIWPVPSIAIQLLEQFGPKCQMYFTIWHLRSPLLMLLLVSSNISLIFFVKKLIQ